MQRRLNASIHSAARPDASRRRALIVSSLLVVWMLVIGVRLAHLQTTQHDWLSERARAQQQAEAEISPARGVILDREGRELARSTLVQSFFADPRDVQDISLTASRLAPLLGLNVKELTDRLKTAKDGDRRFVWLGRKIEQTRADKIAALNLPGVHPLPEPKRTYPNGALAAHVLGYVGTDEVGLGGIEQFYNASLLGEPGKIFVETDGQQRAYASYEQSARSGGSVVLTLDQTIQYYTEQILSDALRQTKARAATAIVLDPHSGEIRALVNAPNFDPNEAGKVTQAVRTNQALQNIYEPGSTFKIIAYSAAIQEGLARPTDRIDCQMGSINVFGRIVHDHHPYGTLTLTEALAKSSNVAAIKTGMRVGNDRMYDYIRRFGFGARTGIELPGETVGLVRPVARWQATSIGSIAIGQEVGVTPVQIAAAFGTLANDGVRIAPHLVRETRKADGTIDYRAAPEQHRVISRETAQALRGMLESVTLNGTARHAQLDGYSAAGKTGTAQKIDPHTRRYSATKYVASFVGFAPVNDPAVVIAVVVDEPVGLHQGGTVAAPVFRDIAERILPLLGVAPDTQFDDGKSLQTLIAKANDADDGFGNENIPEALAVKTDDNANDAGEVIYAASAERALLMPNLRGRSVRDAARICAQLGLQMEAQGEGRVVRQEPNNGAQIEIGQIVKIDFARND